MTIKGEIDNINCPKCDSTKKRLYEDGRTAKCLKCGLFYYITDNKVVGLHHKNCGGLLMNFSFDPKLEEDDNIYGIFRPLPLKCLKCNKIILRDLEIEESYCE